MGDWDWRPFGEKCHRVSQCLLRLWPWLLITWLSTFPSFSFAYYTYPLIFLPSWSWTILICSNFLPRQLLSNSTCQLNFLAESQTINVWILFKHQLLQLLRCKQNQIHIIRQTVKHLNWQFNNRWSNKDMKIYRRWNVGIRKLFFREDAGTYTCRARVPQTGKIEFLKMTSEEGKCSPKVSSLRWEVVT